MYIDHDMITVGSAILLASIVPSRFQLAFALAPFRNIDWGLCPSQIIILREINKDVITPVLPITSW